MGTAVVVAILAVIVVFAARSGFQHIKGEGGCCGGGGSVSVETKQLENPVLGQKIIHIEGMHCDNCRNSVERKINRIEGASCRVNLKKKIAVVSYDRELEDDTLKRAVELLDFTVTGIDTKPADT